VMASCLESSGVLFGVMLGSRVPFTCVLFSKIPI